MIWIGLMLTAPLWWRLFSRRASPSTTPTRASTRKTGPVWEQPTPWVLDLEDEDDV